MTRSKIINQLSLYFSIYELVDKVTYDKYGNRAWSFLDTDALHVLLIIREGINKPININNWKTAKPGDIIYDERGLRTNICDIVYKKTIKKKLYLSGHLLGKAFDFKVLGMNSEDVRDWIIDNQELFPCKIRLEHIILSTGKPISWCHFDTRHEEHNPKIYLFSV